MQPQDVLFPVYIESSEVLSGPLRYLLGGDIHCCDYNLREFSWKIIGRMRRTWNMWALYLAI
jgi:hypothetical protein